MKIETEVYPYNESDKDKTHRLIRSALSAIPVAGGSAVEVFNAIITPPLQVRMQRWTEEVTTALNKLLEDNVLRWEDIERDDSFHSRLIQATTEALKTHQQEKIQALKNAAINSALDTGMGDDEEEILINLVGLLTPTHISVLDIFCSPAEQRREIECFRSDTKDSSGTNTRESIRG